TSSPSRTCSSGATSPTRSVEGATTTRRTARCFPGTSTSSSWPGGTTRRSRRRRRSRARSRRAWCRARPPASPPRWRCRADRGCSEVVLVGQRDRPRLAELRAKLDALVCAEDASGLPTADADLTPSPAALHALDLAGRRVILATTNGTLAAELVRECGVEHVLIGCMRNGDAVMRSAVALARRLDRSISLVCAGREGSL